MDGLVSNLLKSCFNLMYIFRTTLVGKICQTLYPYESQNQDDLSFLDNENLTILEALDKDWVKAQNDRCIQFVFYTSKTNLILYPFEDMIGFK